MVKELEKNDKEYYQCETCKFVYEDKKIANNCQAWCDEHHSCNIEITKNAIQL